MFDSLIFLSTIVIVAILMLWKMFTTVDQAHVGVVTLFGKYRRVLNPGLNIIIPFFEKVRNKIPVQNRTDQLQFSAITGDQAAVHFISTIIFTVQDHTEDTIKLVAFKFIDDASFNTALTSAVEASVREFVSTKKQSEVLGLRQEIVLHAKENLDEQLSSWGYLLVDLTVNDIQFDAEVMQSMSRVVAAKNAQTAAEFEGQALLIQRTKQAEAEGAAIRISAENEATAARLRGEGLAQFREAIAVGFSESAKKLEEAGLAPSILLFSMWTETVRDAAKEGTGNTIFLDGNITTMEQSLHRLQGMLAPAGPSTAPKALKSKK
ncbi:MAG: SPFH domain-containing protein [Actinomycetes bacterium]